MWSGVDWSLLALMKREEVDEEGRGPEEEGQATLIREAKQRDFFQDSSPEDTMAPETKYKSLSIQSFLGVSIGHQLVSDTEKDTGQGPPYE